MDAVRREEQYRVGDRVLLSTKNLNLKGVSNKLKPHFVGPFTVSALVGSNAVRLNLPSSMRMHPVFNISLLKRYQGDM